MTETGQTSGTEHRDTLARARSYALCPDVPGDTSEAGTGHSVGTGTHPGLRPGASPSRSHTVDIEPWPHYDERGNDWWRVRVVGPSGRFWLSWSRRLQRFSAGNDTRLARNANNRLLWAVRQQLIAQLGSPA